MPLTMIGQWHYLQKLFQMTVLLFQFNISPESPVAPKQLNYIRSAQGRWQYDAANSRWHQYLIDNNFLVIRINQLQNIVWMIVTDVKRVIFASSVLPTPVGPRKRNEPSGWFGFWIPALERRMASETLRTASS